jgi:hypothetical protein
MTPALAHTDLLRKLLTCGLAPHADPERLRLTVILNLSSLVGGLFLMIFAIHNLVDGNPRLAMADAITCGIVLASNLHLHRSGNLRLVSGVIIAASCPFFLFVLSRGEVQQATYVWSLSVPVISVSLLGSKSGLRLAALYWILLLAYFLFCPPVRRPHALSTVHFRAGPLRLRTDHGHGPIHGREASTGLS